MSTQISQAVRGMLDLVSLVYVAGFQLVVWFAARAIAQRLLPRCRSECKVPDLEHRVKEVFLHAGSMLLVFRVIQQHGWLKIDGTAVHERDPVGTLPQEMAVLYLYETLMATVSLVQIMFRPVKTKDAHVMVVHHSVTVFLLCVSAWVGFPEYGAGVLSLHDRSDVLIDLSKLFYMAQLKSGVAEATFAVAGIFWAWDRIVWFGWVIVHIWFSRWHVDRIAEAPVSVPILIALTCLLVLNLRWFKMLLAVFYGRFVGTKGGAAFNQAASDYFRHRDSSSPRAHIKTRVE